MYDFIQFVFKFILYGAALGFVVGCVVYWILSKAF
jgi:hypothetical protein